MRAMRRLRPSSYALVASGLLLGGAAGVFKVSDLRFDMVRAS